MATLTIKHPKHARSFLTVTSIDMSKPHDLADASPMIIRPGDDAEVQTVTGRMIQIVEHAQELEIKPVAESKPSTLASIATATIARSQDEPDSLSSKPKIDDTAKPAVKSKK